MNIKYWLFLLASFIFFVPNIAAQENKIGQRWVCLNVEWCLDKEAFLQNKYLPNKACSQAGQNLAVAGHRVRLTAKTDDRPLPNKNTYIIECLSTSKGQVCTTGNSSTDNLIYGKDNVTDLSASDEYQFQGMFEADGVTATANPRMSDSTGEIGPIEWQSYSSGNERKFLALNFLSSQEGESWLGKGAEQQATFSFEAASDLKNCVSINWDPYGRVFDSKTLEPIPFTHVTLLKLRDGGSFTQLLPGEILGAAIENPYTTKEDGAYSFIVPDGTYRLSVMASQYTFPNDPLVLDQNFPKAYSEIYPNQTGQDIVQKSIVQHRDIPIDSKDQGKTYPVKLMQYFYSLNKDTNKIFLEGMASHPKTLIKIYSLKVVGKDINRSRLLKTLQADRFGKFSAEVDQSKFAINEMFGDLELEKVQLTKATTQNFWFMPQVYAQTASTTNVRFNPILNYLEGYAYDNRGNVLANATVGVYLTFSNKAYVETKADSKGYYSISSTDLPNMPYTVRYSSSTGASYPTTTSKLLAQNTSYIVESKVNLNKPAPQTKKSAYFTTPVLSPTPALFAEKAKTSNKSFLLVASILFFLISAVGGLIGVYILKKRQTLS